MKPKQNGETVSVAIDDSQFKALIESIHDLVKVFAATQIQRGASTDRNARFLKVFDLTESEIGDLLGVDRSTVNKALSRTKK